MSDFNFTAKNKKTGEIVEFTAFDDYFGKHKYGYRDNSKDDVLNAREFDEMYTANDLPTPTPPPTGNYFQYRADPNEKKLDFTDTRTCKNGHTMTGIGDDCCPECEAPWVTPPPTDGWEDRIRDILSEVEFLHGVPVAVPKHQIDAVLSIARLALAEQKARMVEEVEGMRHKDELGFKDRPFYGTVAAQNAVLNYNKACDDIIKALRKV